MKNSGKKLLRDWHNKLIFNRHSDTGYVCKRHTWQSEKKIQSIFYGAALNLSHVGLRWHDQLYPAQKRREAWASNGWNFGIKPACLNIFGIFVNPHLPLLGQNGLSQISSGGSPFGKWGSHLLVLGHG